LPRHEIKKTRRESSVPSAGRSIVAAKSQVTELAKYQLRMVVDEHPVSAAFRAGFAGLYRFDLEGDPELSYEFRIRVVQGLNFGMTPCERCLLADDAVDVGQEIQQRPAKPKAVAGNWRTQISSPGSELESRYKVRKVVL
jgi:hypothetical protein